MAFVIVTAPNPPGSKQLISPPVAVFEIAPAKVLHGAVRLHGLASSPTPDTHVRVACACASESKNTQTVNTAKAHRATLVSFIDFPPLRVVFYEQRMYQETKIAQNPKPLLPECRINVVATGQLRLSGNQGSILRKTSR